jgi:hypothetical protein
MVRYILVLLAIALALLGAWPLLEGGRPVIGSWVIAFCLGWFAVRARTSDRP